MNKLNITYAEIFKRTFEGKTNPSKNDDALTSKYYTSKKYLLKYKCREYGNRYYNKLFETKLLAEEAKELMLKYNFNCIEKLKIKIYEKITQVKI